MGNTSLYEVLSHRQSRQHRVPWGWVFTPKAKLKSPHGTIRKDL